MPKAITHAVLLTDDYDATVRFLCEVAGMAPYAPYSPAPEDLAASLGWPAGSAQTRAAIVGEGPGSLDIVEIPADLRGSVATGVALLAIPTGDVAKRAEQARAAGFVVEDPRTVEGAGGVRVTMAPLQVGGIGYELIRFG